MWLKNLCCRLSKNTIPNSVPVLEGWKAGEIKCTECGEPLHFGTYEYSQHICWDCYKAKAMEFVNTNCHNPRDLEMVLSMISAKAERYGQRL